MMATIREQGTEPMTQTIIPPVDASASASNPTILRPEEVAFLHADGHLDPSVPAVETRELRKEYGAKVAVESLTLTVRQGEVFGFLGPNGAGKSTTMKMLMGLVFPTSGAMSLMGRPIGDVAVKRRVGFLPEQFRFHEWMQAGEFLDFHGQLYGMARAERRRRIPEVLELVGLEGEGRNRLKTFSKGMLQRIGLAQAVMNNPALVFLDEPTSALDPVGRREVREVIGRFRSQGMTVFLNSHILSEVEQVCDRCAIIDHGRVVRLGTMEELLAEELTVDITLGATAPAVWNALDTGVTLVGINDRTVTIRIPDEERIPPLVDRLVATGAKVYAVAPHRRTLEDVFMEAIGLTGGAAHGLERDDATMGGQA
jgi:ABC-2 type transport system ATP-binding protein